MRCWDLGVGGDAHQKIDRLSIRCVLFEEVYFVKRLTGERSYIFSMQSIRFQQHARQTKSKFNPQLRLFYPWSGLVAPRRRLCITALRARQMPGRPHHHTHGHQGLHRTSYSRCFTHHPTWYAGGKSSHGCCLRPTRQHVLH